MKIEKIMSGPLTAGEKTRKGYLELFKTKEKPTEWPVDRLKTQKGMCTRYTNIYI